MNAGESVVRAALDQIAGGGMAVVVDDADRENEGDLIMAAQFATPEALAFMVRHTTGIVCAPMTGALLDRLHLPLMVGDNTEPHRTAFTVSVDAAGAGTGVSADDRALTLRTLADGLCPPDAVRRPGHIFPLRYREGGVLKRAGHTEAAIDMLRLAGLSPVAAIAEIVNDNGTMARLPELRRFAERHGLPMLNVAELVRYRRSREQLVVPAGSAPLPTKYGTFRAVAYRSLLDEMEHLALVMGDVDSSGHDAPLVRVHSECLTGDLVGSLRCDCGPQFDHALRLIARERRGVLVYLRGQEGRGIGLGHKLRAYSLQDQGRDTVEANLELGFPVDTREYGIGAQILHDLGVRRLRLITNNPQKYSGLSGHELTIESRVSIPAQVTDANRRYLYTKRDRLGHTLDLRESLAVPDAHCVES